MTRRFADTPKIARISLNGTLTEHPKTSSPKALPFGIVAGADGNIWLVDLFADETGRVTI
jgi:hypothetical protein